mmetsp:Transcript_26080/g.61941  ORF Transcript_26080/g.61941 Transcript_26080/m.61941 type:complete len:200 (-) Transcript_26080:2561-3160(-)
MRGHGERPRGRRRDVGHGPAHRDRRLVDEQGGERGVARPRPHAARPVPPHRQRLHPHPRRGQLLRAVPRRGAPAHLGPAPVGPPPPPPRGVRRVDLPPPRGRGTNPPPRRGAHRAPHTDPLVGRRGGGHGRGGGDRAALPVRLAARLHPGAAEGRPRGPRGAVPDLRGRAHGEPQAGRQERPQRDRGGRPGRRGELHGV